MSIRTRILLSIMAMIAAIFLAGCDPDGELCDHKGDKKAEHGHVYTCKPGPFGNEWQ